MKYEDDSNRSIIGGTLKAPSVSIRIENDANVQDLADAFERFLYAMGYSRDLEVTVDYRESKDDIQISEPK